jgi:hypothetical protein
MSGSMFEVVTRKVMTTLLPGMRRICQLPMPNGRGWDGRDYGGVRLQEEALPKAILKGAPRSCLIDGWDLGREAWQGSIPQPL